MKNYYAILGLPLNADAASIKLAYKQNAKKYHPDLNPGSINHKNRFLEVKDAYDILGDPEKKKAYDKEVAAYRAAKAQQQQINAQYQAHYAAQQQQQAFVSQQQAYAAQQAYAYKQNATSTQLVQLKTYYALQVETIKKNSKKDMADFKERMEKQIDAYKKQSAQKLKQISAQYKQEVEKVKNDAKKFKDDYKKRSFNAGLKKGIKEAQAETKKTIVELNKIIDETSAELDWLRKEKTRMEAEIIKAKEDAAIDASNDKILYARLRDSNNKISAMHKEKTELESELDKTQKKLNKLRLEYVKSEEKYNELASQIQIDKRHTENINQLADKKIVDLETTIAAQAKELKLLNKTLEEKEDILNEYEIEIGQLYNEIEALEKYSKIWKNDESDDDNDINEYEQTQQKAAENTLYGVLGLYLNALPDEIDKAYDNLTNVYANKSEYVDQLVKIVEAYQVLSDPISKAEYDKSIDNDFDLD